MHGDLVRVLARCKPGQDAERERVDRDHGPLGPVGDVQPGAVPGLHDVVRAATDVRREIWRKLIANASGNPISALTRLMLGELGTDAGLRQVMAGIMRETLEVGAALGWDLRAEIDVEKLATRPGRKPDVRSSMLQDVHAKRPLEVEAQFGQIQAFARDKAVAVPTIDVILPLLRGLDRALRAA